jgi:hypothetical protein
MFAHKIKDLVGTKAGVWIVTSYQGNRMRCHDKTKKQFSKENFWLCTCSCGRTGEYSTAVINSAVKTGRMNWCPHLGMTLIGEIKGRLTVTKFTVTNGKGMLECLCVCGNTTFIEPNTWTANRRSSCGCIDNYPHSIGTVYNIPFEKLDYTKAKLHKHILRCRQSHRQHAKDKNIKWLLPLNLAEQIVQSNCNYCNRPAIEQRRGFSGIDRVDSNGSYEPSNCVPCCTPCNTAKMNMTTEEFKDLITRIYKHFVVK